MKREKLDGVPFTEGGAGWRGRLGEVAIVLAVQKKSSLADFSILGQNSKAPTRQEFASAVT